tara:strand:+ start:2176 stop:2694 length:519 start_codon:yes stop_codon:yes gene_type:complete
VKTKNVEKVVRLFSDKVIKQAIRNLEKQNKVDSGTLAQKLNYDLKVYPSGSLELKFKMPEYGLFQDKGVKGKKSGRKAYNSPYKFKSENIAEGVIEEWVKRKGIQGRDKKGRFINRKSLSFLIGRKIALFGLPATRFFSNAFRQHYRKLPKDFVRAYANDVSKFLTTATQQI